MAANPVPVPELELVTEKKGDQILVRGVGRITASTAQELQNTIRSLIPGAKRIVLDLSEVNYIDSSGLGALVSVYLSASKSHCELEMANPKQRIRDLFKLSRLATVFEGRPEYAGWTPD